MTTAQIQQQILDETGIKTSVKKLKGSGKDYLCFSPMFQNGAYPEFPFEWRRNFSKSYPDTEPPSCFVSGTQIQIHKTLLEGEAMEFKRERKPKPISEMKVREWGSKNSQLRLDKAASRYAKRASRPNYNGVRYW